MMSGKGGLLPTTTIGIETPLGGCLILNIVSLSLAISSNVSRCVILSLALTDVIQLTYEKTRTKPSDSLTNISFRLRY